LLEGKNLNLRVAEKDDVSLVAEWWRNPQYMGEHQDVMDISEDHIMEEINHHR